MTNILSAIEALGQAFAGYGTVTLGPVRLSGMEIPASIPIGGKHALTTHRLPGGARVIDAMGQDDDDIYWSGKLDQQNPSIAARTLDKLRRSGAVVTLAWDVFSYQVVVSEFTCPMRLIPPLDYRIRLTVLADNTLVTGITAVSMAMQVVEDLKSGNPIGALSSVSAGIVGPSVTNASSAVGTSGATTLGSQAYNTAVSAVNTASGAIRSAVSAVNATLAPLGTSLGALATAAPTALDTVSMSSQITTAISSAGDLANLTASAGYVSRAQQNLAAASA